MRQKRREKELSFLLRRGYDGAGIYIYTRGSSIEEEAREGIILPGSNCPGRHSNSF